MYKFDEDWGVEKKDFAIFFLKEQREGKKIERKRKIKRKIKKSGKNLSPRKLKSKDLKTITTQNRNKTRTTNFHQRYQIKKPIYLSNLQQGSAVHEQYISF